MPIKINKKLNLKEKFDKAKPKFHDNVKSFIANEILYFISIGVSPVKGGGTNPKNTGGGSRFFKYSKSYLKTIKRGDIKGKIKAPVNLSATGKMLKSIYVTGSSTRTFVKFRSKIAVYHNELGAGKSRIIRRLLPNQKGEEFSKVIQNKIVKALQDAVRF